MASFHCSRISGVQPGREASANMVCPGQPAATKCGGPQQLIVQVLQTSRLIVVRTSLIGWTRTRKDAINLQAVRYDGTNPCELSVLRATHRAREKL
ncbi:hypothetical protein RRG08_048571 [Elysia crispata]|uniref:Uncharacterized protein n=1 Tax=Elysia crispata TaxID=231223 RepID=A0AAE1B5E0_9GAST|nr:hypothetical protein RRG08_048571 [Elysia crispata]